MKYTLTYKGAPYRTFYTKFQLKNYLWEHWTVFLPEPHNGEDLAEYMRRMRYEMFNWKILKDE